MSASVASRANPSERRRFQRVSVELFGRYMLQNRKDFPCRSVDLSPGGLLLCAPVIGAVGERVVVYLDQVGRLEGEITRLLTDGFAMSVVATSRKRDKLAAQLTWLANRRALGLPEDRRHERVTPRVTRSTLHFPNGQSFPARIIDVSVSGAAISSDERPPLGSSIRLGNTPAKVVRLFEGGIAIEFLRPLSDDQMTPDIIF
jgi:hypothetical protein